MADLDALDAALTAAGAPYTSGPARPIDEAEVRSVLGGLGLDPPPEAIEWFGWRNGDGVAQDISGMGVRRTAHNELFGWLLAMTVEDGGRTCSAIRTMFDESVVEPFPDELNIREEEDVAGANVIVFVGLDGKIDL